MNLSKITKPFKFIFFILPKPLDVIKGIGAFILILAIALSIGFFLTGIFDIITFFNYYDIVSNKHFNNSVTHNMCAILFYKSLVGFCLFMFFVGSLIATYDIIKWLIQSWKQFNN
jgi:hypothetical protein